VNAYFPPLHALISAKSTLNPAIRNSIDVYYDIRRISNVKNQGILPDFFRHSTGASNPPTELWLFVSPTLCYPDIKS
jgi:hypothetical protein